MGFKEKLLLGIVSVSAMLFLIYNLVTISTYYKAMEILKSANNCELTYSQEGLAKLNPPQQKGFLMAVDKWDVICALKKKGH
jgi:hypothetical protein